MWVGANLRVQLYFFVYSDLFVILGLLQVLVAQSGLVLFESATCMYF